MNHGKRVVGVLANGLVATGLTHGMCTDVVVNAETFLSCVEYPPKLGDGKFAAFFGLNEIVVEAPFAGELIFFEVVLDGFTSSASELGVVRLACLAFADGNMRVERAVVAEYVADFQVQQVADAETRRRAEYESHAVAESELSGLGVGFEVIRYLVDKVRVADGVGGGRLFDTARGYVGAAGRGLAAGYVDSDRGFIGGELNFLCRIVHTHLPFV